jgi:hypothetical protein
VLTVTSTDGPALCAGAVAAIVVDEITFTSLAADDPNSTVESELKPVPVIVTVFPPAVGPASGLRPVTVGAPNAYKFPVAVGLVPPGVVTVTFTVPADSAGETAVNCVEETNVTPVAAVEPNVTLASGTNPVPVIVTVVPPAVGPASGLRPVTVGPPYVY